MKTLEIYFPKTKTVLVPEKEPEPSEMTPYEMEIYLNHVAKYPAQFTETMFKLLTDSIRNKQMTERVLLDGNMLVFSNTSNGNIRVDKEKGMMVDVSTDWIVPVECMDSSLVRCLANNLRRRATALCIQLESLAKTLDEAHKNETESDQT